MPVVSGPVNNVPLLLHPALEPVVVEVTLGPPQTYGVLAPLCFAAILFLALTDQYHVPGSNEVILI